MAYGLSLFLVCNFAGLFWSLLLSPLLLSLCLDGPAPKVILEGKSLKGASAERLLTHVSSDPGCSL